MRVLIADDHLLLRRGLAGLLIESGYQVVAEAASGLEALVAAERCRPELAVLDHHMPWMDGIETARQLRIGQPGCRVVILTMEGQREVVRRAFRAGAQAYVLKSNAQDEVLAALLAVGRGERYLSPGLGDERLVARLLVETGELPDPRHRLTARERMVLAGVLRGWSNQQIAEQAVLGVRTVETHRGHMMEKLGVSGRDQLLRLAIARGWVSLDGEGNILGEPPGERTG
jgi:two-component system response regulator NreC